MSKIFNLPPKIQPAADIQLPPNFELYSRNAEKVEEVHLNLPPRLGENNPLVFPCQPSLPIKFEGSEMSRLNLDNLLNPHQNDIEFMEKELKDYRQQVQMQNEEFKNLERQRNEIKAQGQADPNMNYDYLAQQQEAKQRELARIQSEKQALLNALRSKQAGFQESHVMNASPSPAYQNTHTFQFAQPQQAPQTTQVVSAPYDDFFDRKEIIQVERPVAAAPTFSQANNFVVSSYQQPPQQYQQVTYVQNPSQPRMSNTTFVNKIPQASPAFHQPANSQPRPQYASPQYNGQPNSGYY